MMKQWSVAKIVNEKRSSAAHALWICMTKKKWIHENLWTRIFFIFKREKRSQVILRKTKHLKSHEASFFSPFEANAWKKYTLNPWSFCHKYSPKSMFWLEFCASCIYTMENRKGLELYVDCSRSLWLCRFQCWTFLVPAKREEIKIRKPEIHIQIGSEWEKERKRRRRRERESDRGRAEVKGAKKMNKEKKESCRHSKHE